MSLALVEDRAITENIPAVRDPETQEVIWPQVKGIPADLTGPLNWGHPCSAHLQVVTNNGTRAIMHTQPRRKKVCIVGYAENSRHLAWYNDPDCEIWGVNQLYRFIPRADRWFQIHTDWNDSKKWADGADLNAWLKTCPIPVYMCSDEPTIPNGVAYPKAWVKAALGTHEYFTSSIAMMLALAIAEGFEEIGIYGIDLIVGREYHFEKACVEFYLGIAHAKGIHYHLPENSALLWQSHTYGFEEEPSYGFYGLAKLRERTKALAKIVEDYKIKSHTLKGRLDEADYLLKAMKDDASRKKMRERVGQLEIELSAALNHLYLHDGAQQEVASMYGILELRSRGGSVS